ncbi:MAG: acyl-CoA thioesterase [Myxococcota bacterium]
MAVHEHRLQVYWGHCDPAGIVYFPRFFDMFHEAMETWFSAELGAPYDDVIVRRKIGFPSVHTEADFSKPTAFGESIVVELRLEHLGTRSMRLGYRIRGEDDPEDERGRGATVCAVMDLDPASPRFRRSTDLPDDLRAAMTRFMG